MKIVSAELQYIGHFNIISITLRLRRASTGCSVNFAPQQLPDLLRIAGIDVEDDGNNLSELVGNPVMVKFPDCTGPASAIGNVYNDTKWMEIK